MKRVISFIMGFLLVISSLMITPVMADASSATYYVDPSGNDSNNGISASTPWKTLDKVNSTTFQPGDTILFKAGGTWTGTLHPLGSGSSSAQITIDMYGTGNKPIIAGNGATNAVLLDGQEYWTINNLEVTNTASDRAVRNGIMVYAKAAGITHRIHVTNCDIHDVTGENRRALAAPYNMYYNSGIHFSYLGQATESNCFDEILIENNNVSNVLTSGIKVDETDGSSTDQFFTNVVIRNNVISKTGSDGIIVGSAVNPLIEYNCCYDAGYNGTTNETLIIAGIWECVTNGATFQYNEVARTALFQSDGTAFDTDFGTGGTVIFQYNYTHGNGGGFWLDCAGISMDPSYVKTILRYNISVDDIGYLTRNGQTYAEIYNNVFYKSSGSLNADFNSTGAKHKFWNNVFNFQTSPDWQSSIYVNNLYYPCAANSLDASAKTANPKFVNPGTPSDGMSFADNFKIQSTSPLINTGINIPGTGSTDFWGNTLYSGLADIGAEEYPNGTGGGYSPIISGNTYKLVNVNSGKVLGIKNASTADGAAAVQWTDNNTTDHDWILTLNSDSTYKLTNVNSGKVLGVQNASTLSGAAVLQWADNGTTDHNWTLVPYGGGAYKLINANSGLALGIAGAGITNGIAAIQWENIESADQLFVLVPVSYQLESYNYSSYFICHNDFLGKLATGLTTIGDSEFRIVPGLADSSAVSLESVNYPGYYFRHSNYILKLQQPDGTSTFNQDATFYMVSGLADSSYISFKSYNYPTRYIRHYNYGLRIDPVSTSLEKQDATFKLELYTGN